MKKITFILLLSISFFTTAKAQFFNDVDFSDTSMFVEDYLHYPPVECEHWLGSKYDLKWIDTIAFDSCRYIRTSALKSNRDDGIISNVVHTDIRGRLLVSPISELSIPPTFSVPTSISSGARSFNTAYQISSTRPCKISISPQIACVLSLTTGQAGNVQLQISANGTTGWITIGQLTASSTGTLVIGLNTSQVSGTQLVSELPIGYYWKALTTNTTGTPTYTFNGGSQTVY